MFPPVKTNPLQPYRLQRISTFGNTEITGIQRIDADCYMQYVILYPRQSVESRYLFAPVNNQFARTDNLPV